MGAPSLARRVVLSGKIDHGIEINFDKPQYCWRDLEGVELIDKLGVDGATLETYRGKVRDFVFGVGDVMDIRYHVPHDYVPNSPLFFHLHWSHNGTTISGTFEATATYTYAKGHDQDEFRAPKELLIADPTGDITATPAYRHRIPEVQLADNTETASMLDQKDIEVDGLILLNLEVTGIPTITGGAGKPFIHRVDMHYLSTSIGTLNKAPYFYE